MADVSIKVLKNGPYVVTGPVQLVDHTGAAHRVEAGKPVALCRCGQSASRPFCDGTHGRCGFVSEETAAGRAG